ncbi:uncharacterized protein LOC112044680 [Bicyclus anynana]|uniref:Uncharacterized protein LOC112044680 n=1 Tax=Bicyclus anynana TaxID=110368 RepID=A0A6J1MTU1_BICAN|nr:uncharacterized protein LOC112044680 [Bicyclus anynana]
MSTIEDDLIVPWVGSTCYKNSLSVVVLSTNNTVIDNIAEALMNVHEMGDFSWKLVVLRSLCLKDITEQSQLTGKLSIDFIIIAVDSSRLFCLDWANDILKQVHPDLRICRVVLVNAMDSSIHDMAVNSSELVTFCSTQRLDMLTANVSKQKDVNFLARRLLKYIEVSFGVNTGIPNVNI